MTRHVVLLLIMIFSFTVSGCQTIKCTSEGAATGAVKGAKQDWKDSCENVEKTDTWIKKNLW